jgi:HSP20 family protein
MTTVTWQPLPALQEKIESDVQEPTQSWRSPRGAVRQKHAEWSWSPAIDFFDQDEQLIVEAELPGVDRSTMAVQVVDHVLNIKAERLLARRAAAVSEYLSERPQGSYARSVPLPASVETEQVKVEYIDGVLRVVLPRKLAN